MAQRRALRHRPGLSRKRLRRLTGATASFAGSVTWTDCNVNCSSWLAIAVVKPTTSACTATDWQDTSDPNIEMVWSSGGQHGNLTLPFEVTAARILQGVYGQRLCLDGIQSYTNYPEQQPTQQLLASKVMEVEPPPAPATPTPVTLPGGNAPTLSTKCILASREVRRLKKKLKRAEQHDLAARVLAADRKALVKAKGRKKSAC